MERRVLIALKALGFLGASAAAILAFLLIRVTTGFTIGPLSGTVLAVLTACGLLGLLGFIGGFVTFSAPRAGACLLLLGALGGVPVFLWYAQGADLLRPLIMILPHATMATVAVVLLTKLGFPRIDLSRVR
ncbi:MAG TPA: hypothetical protein VNZ52_11335 [Candidatus Thermoplasmatota archaeon]|nr:hypothetical protein [Candidatus Thermoplasmatota archaeon]